MRLRHFHADRPATDDDKMSGAFTVLENILVRIEGNLVEARYGRHEGARTGCDHEAPGRDLRIAGDYRAAIAKAGVLLDDGNAQAFEPRDGIVRRDRSDHPMHMVVHPGEVRSEEH